MTTGGRFIFSINSGRAGSQYLARVLDTAHRVRAFHEAEPQMIGPYLRMINDQPNEQTYDARRFKADALRDYFDAGDPSSRRYWRKRLMPWSSPLVYADTSHMFIKTFADVVMNDLVTNEFDAVDVIILRRPLPQVLRSFFELKYFDSGEAWPDWMSSPNAVTAAITCIAPDSELDHVDKCIGYLVDIEARTQRFRDEYPHVRTHEVTLDELNSWTSVTKLFGDLEIEPTRATKQILGRAVNVKRSMKSTFGNWTTVEYCAERIRTYLDRARELGIEIPDSLKHLADDRC